MFEYFKLNKYIKQEVAKSKYNFYKNFILFMSIMAALISPLYFISDCQIFGRFAYETLFSRFMIYGFLLIYLIIIKKCNNYKIISILSHIICHLIMWGTIGAIFYLPDKSHCSEGFIIFQILILLIGIGTPIEISIISQLMIIGNISLSNIFIHYENFNLLMSIGIPMCLGAIFMQIPLNNIFYLKYLSDKKLELYSYTDQLTNLYNRHKFIEYIKNKNLNDTIFIICDIDFFKKINDEYGHDCGDDILTYVATIFKKILKDDDSIYRWGGEEFLILLKDKTELEAFEIVEKLRKEVKKKNEFNISLTMSFGISSFKDNYKNTIKLADTALYYAKEKGRDKTIRYSQLNL